MPENAVGSQKSNFSVFSFVRAHAESVGTSGFVVLSPMLFFCNFLCHFGVFFIQVAAVCALSA